jgi:hypothetical protein
MPTQKPSNPFPAWRLPKGIIKASDGDLERSIGSCERWAWIGGALVIGGVAAEVSIAAYHPPYDSWMEQWGSALANSLVAIGVALEIIFSQMAGLRQSELRRRSDEIAAEATKRAAEANQKAQEAALELARLTTPRVISPKQKEQVVEAVKPCGFRRMRTVIPIDCGQRFRSIADSVPVIADSGSRRRLQGLTRRCRCQAFHASPTFPTQRKKLAISTQG